MTFTWVWQKTHFRVTANAGQLPGSLRADSSQYVSPSNVWCAVNDRVTIVAEAAIGVGTYRFSSWSVVGKIGDYFGFYDGTITNDAQRVDNGTALSFTVYEPVVVTANYKLNAPEKDAPVGRTLTVTPEPADMAEFALLSGSLNWGENTIYDSVIHLAPGAGSHIDATGGVWACTGWILDLGDIGLFPVVSDSMDINLDEFEEEFGISLTNVISVWEHQGTAKPEGSDDDDGPTPGPISITALEQTAPGSWVITVTGAVKDCWYWLYATDDLSKFAGDVSGWTADKAVTTEANPQQAAADGDIVFHATGGSGSALFWRARATSKEDGN